jgi:hypothetical protein
VKDSLQVQVNDAWHGLRHGVLGVVRDTSERRKLPQLPVLRKMKIFAHRGVLFLAAWGLVICLPAPAYAMHIAEGIITGWPALAYTLIGVGLMGVGGVRPSSFSYH